MKHRGTVMYLGRQLSSTDENLDEAALNQDAVIRVCSKKEVTFIATEQITDLPKMINQWRGLLTVPPNGSPRIALRWAVKMLSDYMRKHNIEETEDV